MATGALIPGWLLVGLAIGGSFAVLALAAFVAGGRLFPTRSPSEGPEGGRGAAEGGERRRREEIRQYLDSIGERFVEDHEVAGHVVDFYLPHREVAVTFDAKAFLGLRESPVHPVLCEHEMPGSHLGARLPFETPPVDPAGDDRGDGPDEGPRWADGSFGDRWRARQAYWNGTGDREGDPAARDPRSDREAVRASFAALGLPPDASGEEVRAAYRNRIKEVHPDQGGDPEQFQRIQDAYATAKDHAD